MRPDSPDSERNHSSQYNIDRIAFIIAHDSQLTPIAKSHWTAFADSTDRVDPPIQHLMFRHSSHRVAAACALQIIHANSIIWEDEPLG